MAEPLDLDTRLRALSLEERTLLAMASNARVRYEEHREAARQESTKLRVTIARLRRSGVSTKTIAMVLGWSKSYVSRFGRLPPVRSRTV
jgi:hypothetical protein